MVASCYQIWKETKRILQFKNLRQHRSYLGIPSRPVALLHNLSTRNTNCSKLNPKNGSTRVPQGNTQCGCVVPTELKNETKQIE